MIVDSRSYSLRALFVVLTVHVLSAVRQVVQWFVERGCKDMELCLALTAAASSSRVEVAAFLLSHVPHHVLQTLSAEILKVLLEPTLRVHDSTRPT